MRNDVQTLDFALSLFSQTSAGSPFLRGSARDIWFLLAHTPQENCPDQQRISQLFLHINQDIWNVATLFDRLEWMSKQALDNKDLEDRWWYYTTLDIQSFHIEVRSALDYVAAIVRLFAPKPGQVTDTNSFRKLLEWIKDNPGRLQTQVVELLLEQVEWFHELRAVRDKLVHQGAHTIVFASPRDGILFQVVQGRFRNVIDKPILMYNENVAYFDRYAALYFARLLGFLEDLASFYVGTLANPFTPVAAENHAAGYGIVTQWMRTLREKIAATAA